MVLEGKGFVAQSFQNRTVGHGLDLSLYSCGRDLTVLFESHLGLFFKSRHSKIHVRQKMLRTRSLKSIEK